MSDTTDNNINNVIGFNFVRERPCRVAYSLDGYQPVRCTIVSDQPLFYMDFEGAIEDEFESECENTADHDDPFGLEAIETGLEELKQKITSLDRLAESCQPLSMERTEHFFENISWATQPFQSSKPDDIAGLTKILEQSRLAAAFLGLLEEHDTELSYSAQTETALYDRLANKILINPNLPQEEQILLAARELRRVWQHRNGALIHPLTFHPDQAILVNRAQIADLSVMMVRIAWELQLAGHETPWERLENSTMADLAHAFARESFMDFRTLNNGAACGSVFESWFLSERCRHEDRELIQTMLSDYQGYVFEMEEPSQSITSNLIAALGSMPFGKNYLVPHMNTIMNDAIFTEVRDRSNANFLWFVKFERSFRETERDLQDQETVTDRGVFHGSSHKKDKNGRTDNNEQTAHIISLSSGGERDHAVIDGQRKNKRRAGAGAEIISFYRDPEQ